MSNNPFSLGTYNVTPPTLSDGQTHQVELDVNANLKIAALPAGAAIIGQVEVTDGTNVLGTSSHPVRVDPTGGTTQPVSGTVTATQGTGTNLHVVVDSAPTTAVTGTVTANAGTGTFATQDAADGSTGSAVPTKATLVGASKSGNLTALLLDSSGNLNVNVAAGGGSGGTSSTFGSAFPSTGTAVGATDGTNMQPLAVDASKNLKTIVNAALPAGTNVIGHVIADSGSTTAVTSLPATPAGTNLIGKVGIDQTTPGTTNGVQVNAALPAGTNLMGKVGIDQTTPGTTNGVQDIADGPVSAGTAATKSTLMGGVAATAAPGPTNGQQIAVQLDTKANQRVVRYGHTGSFSSTTGSGTTTVTITVPAATKWVVKSIYTIVNNPAGSSPLAIALLISDAATHTLGTFIAGANSGGASTTTAITWGPSCPTSTAIVSNNLTVGIPELTLGPGMTIQFLPISAPAGTTVTIAALIELYPD